MKKYLIKIFLSIIYITYSLNFISAVPVAGLDGRTAIKFNSGSWVFRRSGGVGLAQGFVKFDDGFTIFPDTKAQFDIVAPISGSIDLRETGTMELITDLHLDSNATITSGGKIYGNGKALYLDGDLTVTSVLHINGNTIIDGNGSNIYFAQDSRNNFAQIFVDSNITLTLRNVSLKQLNYTGTAPSTTYPIIKMGGLGSQLVLDNVILAPSTDFLFNQGQLYIYDDVLFTGTASFIYTSPSPCYIDINSCLYFDKGTTFSFAPNTADSSAKDLIKLKNKNSSIFFDTCSLKTTSTGLRLTIGSVFFDGKVEINSNTGTQINDLILLRQMDYTDTCSSVAWNPNGRFVVIGGAATNQELQLYSFDGTRLSLLQSYSVGSVVNSVSWSPDGKYLAIASDLSGNQIQVFRFNGSNLAFITSYNYAANCRSVAWSFDNQFLLASGHNKDAQVELFLFDGTQLIYQDREDGPDGNIGYTVSWHPSGKYLVYGSNISGGELRPFSFNGINDIQNLTNFNTGGNVYSVAWSPDGKYLATAVDSSGNEIQIYSFNGQSFTQLQTINYGSACNSVRWSPDGKYLIIAGADSANAIQVYSFNGSTLNSTPIKTVTDYGNTARAADWSPDQQNILACGQATGKQIMLYSSPLCGQSSSSQTLSTGINFGNKSLGSPYYDLDANFLAEAYVITNGILKDDSY